jgi:spoIIIJ-associated protein
MSSEQEEVVIDEALADADPDSLEAVITGEAEFSESASRESALENEGEISADYLEELLDIADLDGDIDTYVEGGRAHVSILTDSSVLIGPNSEVLEALQELCRLVVMTETGRRSRLMLDIGGYREKRRKELQDLAQDAITEAKATGEQIPLPAMNPFERKIVHDAVAASGLRSESEGVEPQRHVVIHPVMGVEEDKDDTGGEVSSTALEEAGGESTQAIEAAE